MAPFQVFTESWLPVILTSQASAVCILLGVHAFHAPTQSTQQLFQATVPKPLHSSPDPTVRLGTAELPGAVPVLVSSAAMITMIDPEGEIQFSFRSQSTRH